MKELKGNQPVWMPDRGDGTYQNPVIHADYSDPDVIRVGDDFFMVASSFSHVPGLPVLHSKDLVNWKIVNYVIDRLPLPGYDRPQHGKGVWAPSIRYHDGRFWVFFGAPDEGIFMSTAEDPFGTWDPLHLVKEGKGLIDPCPFWDDDGRAYLVHAFAASRCGIKHKLRICPMSADGRRLLDDGKIVFDGTLRHPTLEGPKIYKRNGYYYIFAPAGGVPTGWQAVFRSRHIYGPYEDKIVLNQGQSPVNGPHQGAWVELENGENWFIHFQDRDAYGRIVHLQPMEWVGDWPFMGQDRNGDMIGEPVQTWTKPGVGTDAPVCVPQTSDEFSTETLGLQWQWQANPEDGWLSLTANPGHLRLYASRLPEGARYLHEAPQLLMQKFPAPRFSAVTEMMWNPDRDGDRAGLIVFGFTYRYLAMGRSDTGDNLLCLVEGSFDDQGGGQEHVLAQTTVRTGKIWLKAEVAENALCTFSYSVDGQSFTAFGDAFQAAKSRWVGAKVGLFSVNMDRVESAGFADFSWFRIAE